MTATTTDDKVRRARRAVGAVRRRASERSLRAFAETYLPEHFTLPHSPLHLELFALLEGLSARPRDKGGRIAVAAPRGHAKSTVVSLGYALWSLCLQREPYIALVSDTADQAVDLLAHVKRELTSNDRLREDFPEVCERPGSRPAPPRWRRGDIVTASGARVRAFGAGQRMRGSRQGPERPTLIILDDIENEELARSEDQRAKRMEWLKGTALLAGTTRTNVVVVGTILHYDSVLARLLDPRQSPGWTTVKRGAVVSWSARPELWQEWESVFDGRSEFEGRTGPEAARRLFEAGRDEMMEGAEALWPERESYLDLMVMRARDGRASFDCEKQNEPVDPAEALFREADFRHWDDDHATAEALLSALGPAVTIVGACDPSLGKAGRNRDDTAIVTLAKHRPTGTMYVLDADIRRRKPDEIIEAIIAYDRVRRFASFGVEEVQFQEFLKSELERRSRVAGRPVPVHGLKQTVDKLGRIQRLQPLITSGAIRFSRRHTALLDQLRRFPHGAHDDGPDALEMAVRAAERGVARWVEVPEGVLL